MLGLTNNWKFNVDVKIRFDSFTISELLAYWNFDSTLLSNNNQDYPKTGILVLPISFNWNRFHGNHYFIDVLKYVHNTNMADGFRILARNVKYYDKDLQIRIYEICARITSYWQMSNLTSAIGYRSKVFNAIPCNLTFLIRGPNRK